MHPESFIARATSPTASPQSHRGAPSAHIADLACLTPPPAILLSPSKGVNEMPHSSKIKLKVEKLETSQFQSPSSVDSEDLVTVGGEMKMMVDCDTEDAKLEGVSIVEVEEEKVGDAVPDHSEDGAAIITKSACEICLPDSEDDDDFESEERDPVSFNRRGFEQEKEKTDEGVPLETEKMSLTDEPFEDLLQAPDSALMRFGGRERQSGQGKKSESASEKRPEAWRRKSAPPLSSPRAPKGGISSNPGLPPLLALPISTLSNSSDLQPRQQQLFDYSQKAQKRWDSTTSKINRPAPPPQGPPPAKIGFVGVLPIPASMVPGRVRSPSPLSTSRASDPLSPSFSIHGGWKVNGSSSNVEAARAAIEKINKGLDWATANVKAEMKRHLERIQSYPPELPLSVSWTLFFTKTPENTGAGKQTYTNYSQEQQVIFTASTVPALCSSLKALQRNFLDHTKGLSNLVTSLKPGSSLSFFQTGIDPLWEADANLKGGRLTFTPSAGLLPDQMFFQLVFLLAGSTAEDLIDDRRRRGVGSYSPDGVINGMILASRRPGGEKRFEIWVAPKEPDSEPLSHNNDWVAALKEVLIRELDLRTPSSGPKGGPVSYKRHFGGR